MPQLCLGTQCWPVAAGDNLLDALNRVGASVPYSCRAGHCHACLVRVLEGQADDARPDALSQVQRADGWHLACQCRVVSDIRVAPFDPRQDALPARVSELAWRGEVLCLRLQPARPLRYRAGQHLTLWLGGVARPYSLASLAEEDTDLAFHIDTRRPGAFCDRARQLQVGDSVALGEVHGGALHYDPDWQSRPLWLLAAGTGLAPLWAILRAALAQGHSGPIEVLHLAHAAPAHYLTEALTAVARQHPQLKVTQVLPTQLPDALAALRVTSRQTVALACGAPSTVALFAKRLFLAGVPRGQVLTEAFDER